MGRPSKGLRFGITVRMPADVFRAVAVEAQRDGVSVNEWIVRVITARITELVSR